MILAALAAAAVSQKAINAMAIFFNLLLRTMAVFITASLLPGVKLADFLTAVFLVVVLGVLNTVIKPILIIFTLPINFLTLGLFTFIINALLVWFASQIVPGFFLASFWHGLLFSLVLSLVNNFLSSLKND